jgi:5'-methylthioadenosine phosphorylase
LIGILGASRYEAIVEGQLERSTVSTRYGDVSVLTGTVGDRPVAYIRRFGWEGNLASDVVSHASHALAFLQLGVRRAITLNGFGGVNTDLGVGDLVVYHDYIKMCERTPTTIFAGEPTWPRAKMEAPFCPEVRETLAAAARRNSQRRVIDQAVNICVQGPHNETPAEIEAYRRWGADIVCTTVYPEVVYFRELEICFAGLCWISDAAGVSAQKDWVRITPEELTPIVRDAIASIPEKANCECQRTWAGSETPLPEWYLERR